MKHSVCDGKYELTFDSTTGKMTALRNGELWERDLTGDKLMYWMLVEINNLKEELEVKK